MPIPALLFAMILSLLAGSASAQVTIENVLVGFTSATFTGNQGALALTAACQAQFPGTRMCTSEEVMNSRTVPGGLTGTAWVRPKVLAMAGTSSTQAVDASGVVQIPDNMSCGAWAFTNNWYGLTVSATGSFSVLVCSEPRAVACCGRPIEPANGDLDNDGMATIRDDAVLRRMLAGLPVPAP